MQNTWHVALVNKSHMNKNFSTQVWDQMSDKFGKFSPEWSKLMYPCKRAGPDNHTAVAKKLDENGLKKLPEANEEKYRSYTTDSGS